MCTIGHESNLEISRSNAVPLWAIRHLGIDIYTLLGREFCITTMDVHYLVSWHVFLFFSFESASPSTPQV